MAERLGIAVIPGIGWSADDIRNVARAAEDAGFEAIFSTEVNNDAMATAQLMGSATERITVGTWIANIYVRNSYTCAQGAALIADATGGRFVLGLGVGHPPVNEAMGIEMGDTLDVFRRYLTEVRGWLRGEGPPTHLPQHPAPVDVPIYAACMTSSTVEIAAELADGLMPLFWSVDRVRQSREWVERGRAKSDGSRPLDFTLGFFTFIGDDLDIVHEVARQNLQVYARFPAVRHLVRVAGFEEEADLMEQGNGLAGFSDRLIDWACLVGTPEECKERMAEYREAGVELPILYPGVGVQTALDVIGAFRQ